MILHQFNAKERKKGWEKAVFSLVSNIFIFTSFGNQLFP